MNNDTGVELKNPGVSGEVQDALTDGFRESEESWKDVLLDLKRRGLTFDPRLAIRDGALGFWKALPQVLGSTRTQRCWVHKKLHVLNKLPKHLQANAKSAEGRWLKLRGTGLIAKLLQGVQYKNGVEVQKENRQEIAA